LLRRRIDYRHAQSFQVKIPADGLAGLDRTSSENVSRISHRAAGHFLQMLETFVGDHGVAEQEPPEVFQAGDAFETFVGERGVAQVQTVEFSPRRQAEVGDAALRATEILHLRQPDQFAYTVVPYVDLCVEVPADVQFLEVLQAGEGFEDAVAVFVASSGIPDGAGQVEFTQGGQAGEFLEFGRNHYGARKVYGHDA